MNDLLLYLTVLLTATLPVFELFAIPPGIALGLSPILVGALAITGNGVVTVVTVSGWERLTEWWERKRGKQLATGARSARGRRVFERFGIPGLAPQGPVGTGIYFAALIALGLGGSRRQVLSWCLVSITLWAIALVVATVTGVELLVG